MPSQAQSVPAAQPIVKSNTKGTAHVIPIIKQKKTKNKKLLILGKFSNSPIVMHLLSMGPFMRDPDATHKR
jgi:hypothetical protein